MQRPMTCTTHKVPGTFPRTKSTWYFLRCLASAALTGLVVAALTGPAYADTATIQPDGDVTAGFPNVGTDDASCAGGTHCDQVDDAVSKMGTFLFCERLGAVNLGFCQQAGGRRLCDETARIQDFQGNRLMVLREVNDDRPQLFGVVNAAFGNLHQQHVNGRIIPHV